MDCSIVEDTTSLRALAEPWRGLAARARARPFQEFGWHAAWFSTLGAAAGCRPSVAVLRQGERLLGVLPLARRRRRGVRLLEWSGAGVTDYCDALLDPALEPWPALAALWRAVWIRGGFDVAKLGQVRADAAVDGLLADLPRRVEIHQNTHVLPIVWGSGERWLATRSANTRQHIGRRTRRLAEAGAAFWVWSPGDPLRPTLDALVAQKRAWSAATGRHGPLAGPGGPDFVRAVAEAMAERGALHLSALRVDGRPIACLLGFVRDDTLYYWLPTYDLAWAKHSPGLVLRSRLIGWCCERGVGRLDFGIGAEGYKLQLGCRTEPLRTHLLPRGPLGRAVTAAYRVATGPGVARLGAGLRAARRAGFGRPLPSGPAPEGTRPAASAASVRGCP